MARKERDIWLPASSGNAYSSSFIRMARYRSQFIDWTNKTFTRRSRRP